MPSAVFSQTDESLRGRLSLLRTATWSAMSDLALGKPCASKLPASMAAASHLRARSRTQATRTPALSN
jgi:hypothetical protein